MKRKLAIITLALCLAIGVVGCGDNGKSKDSDKKSEDTAKKDKKAEIKAFEIEGLDKYVTLGEYKGLTGEKSNLTITDQDVEQQINYALSAKPIAVEDRPVQDGDICNIDYVGTVDGVEFEGGKDTGFDLTIGSDSFIEGFEEGLIGATKGQNLDVNVTFPEGYQKPEMSGKAAVFNVTVNSISTPAELTDEWVAANSEYKTIDEYKTNLKHSLEKSNDGQADYYLKSGLFSQVVANSPIADYPKEALDKEVQSYKDQIEKNYAAAAGMSLDDYIAAMELSVEDFESMCLEQSKSRLGQKMIVQAVMDAEGMKFTQADFDKAIDEFTVKFQFENKEAMLEAYGEEVLKDNILWDKVCDIIVKNAQITETEAPTGEAEAPTGETEAPTEEEQTPVAE